MKPAAIIVVFAALLGTPAACSGPSSPRAPEVPAFDAGDATPPDRRVVEGPPMTGDNLVKVAQGEAPEAVDITANGQFAVLCGGFGATVFDIRAPGRPVSLGSASDRCQHATFGPVVDGAQILYLTHHGDSWVPLPFLRTFSLASGNSIREVNAQEDPTVLWEGAAWQNGYLYVAAHAGGVRVYETDAKGVPRFVRAVAGFGNAWKVEVAGAVGYVVDNDRGVAILSLADPRAPRALKTVKTNGQPRDLTVIGGRVFVALGGEGVDVFDVLGGPDLKHVRTIDTRGSAQSVSADREVLAVAAWNHVAAYDTKTLELLATERTRKYPEFEQDLGVASRGDYIFVAEWESLFALEYRPDRVAPDLWIDEEQYLFAPGKPGARAVIVRNLGRLPLSISNVAPTDPAYSVDKTRLELSPGAADAIELTFSGQGAARSALLRITSNDPDPGQAAWEGGLVVSNDRGIDVGDKVSERFAFLDPSGAGRLEGLRGQVIVLAYFALF